MVPKFSKQEIEMVNRYKKQRLTECRDKIKYSNKEDCRFACIAMVKDKNSKDTYAVYKCKYCDGYHYGHYNRKGVYEPEYLVNTIPYRKD